MVSAGRLMGTRATGRRTNVLVLTPEVGLVRLTRSILKPGYEVAGANMATGADCPDIVFVDTQTVDLDVLSRAKQAYPKAQVIALCREYREADCVAVLEMDVDYLQRPFRARDLAARVRVAELQRFNTTVRRRYYRKGALIFDLFDRKLAIEGRPIALAPSELTVLTLLASRAGAIATYDQLLAESGLVCSESKRHALHRCVYGLRRKIERDPLHPEILLTEPGVGYRLAASVEERRLGKTDQSPGDDRQVRLG
jgi:two-component system, OmpR family, KDP operon response regulator KdpE